MNQQTSKPPSKSKSHNDAAKEAPDAQRDVETAPARTLITKEDHVDYYLNEGDRLLRSGVQLDLLPTVYIAAYPALQAYLREHGDALAERGVVSAEGEAGQVLIVMLQEAQPAGWNIRQAPRDPVVHAAAGKLTQVRDGLRRVTRGTDAAAVRTEFGLDQRISPDSAASVLQGIELFLAGARKLPDRLRSFRLIPSDLAELEEHRDRLRGLPAQAEAPQPPRLPPQALRALAAVDAYFASMAAAISIAFPDGDPRRLGGLKLIPRSRERRERSVRPLPRLWRPALPTIDE